MHAQRAHQPGQRLNLTHTHTHTHIRTHTYTHTQQTEETFKAMRSR